MANPNPPPIVLWQDIFVLIDDGRATVDDQRAAERLVVDASERFPAGMGCLVVIPQNASPPPEDVRREIKAVLTRLAPRLRCLAWVVEGSGFRAAMVRGVLTGLRMMARYPYPTQISESLPAAVSWILDNLDSARAGQLNDAVDAIQRERRLRGLPT